MRPKLVYFLVVLLLITLPGFSAADRQDVAGTVYVMNNDSNDNKVVIFNRDAKGNLTEADSISTDGQGSGGGLDPLGSQGSLTLSADNRWLLAVNAGSDEISVFRILPEGLALMDTVDSGGDFPTSITVYHNLVYVLNANSPNITGFTLSHTGELTPLASSTRALGSGAFSQVAFDPQGKRLVVTDRGDNEILVFPVGPEGLPAMAAITSPSSGAAPFGFIFDQRGHLLVTEAGSGAVSSYEVLPDGALDVISPTVANGQVATCWVAANKSGNAFTANTGSNTISAYRIHAGSGSLALLNATAANTGADTGPIDLATTENGRFLYVLEGLAGEVGMFRINSNGSLTALGTVGSDDLTAPFVQGIVAK